MADFSRHTGLPLSNYESALQCVEVIFVTRLYSVVMARDFGGGLVELLGRLFRADLFALFMQLLATAIDVFEPRLKVRRMVAQSDVDQVRLGDLRMRIEADFRPNALKGDFSVVRPVVFGLTVNQGVVRAVA